MTVHHTCPRCGHRSELEELHRSVHIGQRTIGDYQALRRGRLPQRLIRRSVTCSLMRALWRS
jgi:hypothetical protein